MMTDKLKQLEEKTGYPKAVFFLLFSVLFVGIIRCVAVVRYDRWRLSHSRY